MEEYGETKETVTYYLDGTQVIREIRSHVDDGTKDIFYYYDENGAPVGMSYGGPTYCYYKNIFGDILGIFDENGTLVVRYYYDAWGNIISTTGSMASTLGRDNPFRYRGYYYDNETGFYYLNARYYNPEWGRFISVDGVLDVGNSVGCNLFAYCGNDPVNRIDPLGEAWWHWALGAAVVIGCAAATVITCGGFAAAATAVCFVSNGVAAATTASTVAAAAFVGSATVYGGAVLSAASVSNSVEEFNELGNWGLVAATVAGGAIGGYNGYHLANSQNALSQKEPTHNFDGSKNENYANKRGWTNEMINSAVDDGRQGTSINMANNAPCTVYRYPGTSNQYVVIENATRSVVQLSNFNDPNWIPDTRIIWDP